MSPCRTFTTEKETAYDARATRSTFKTCGTGVSSHFTHRGGLASPSIGVVDLVPILVNLQGLDVLANRLEAQRHKRQNQIAEAEKSYE